MAGDMAVTKRRMQQEGRGRDAAHPGRIPMRGWKDIFWRVFNEIMADRVMLVAAGVTFYLLLALFPALAAFVSLYGFFADPATIAEHIAYLAALLPAGGLDLISQQLDELIEQDSDSLSFGFLIGFAIAFWSANNGVKALFEALNIAYEEAEKRGIVALNLLSFGFTLIGMLVGIVLVALVGVLPAVAAFLNLEGITDILVRVFRWPLTFLFIAAVVTLIYRYAPSRERAKWRWITWGGLLATAVWILASLGFSFYLQNIADYNATYGSLGAVVGFMVWIWISVLILLVGAELNAEMEHQTGHDSTAGAPKPIGERGAVVADTLGESRVEAERGEAPADPARDGPQRGDA
ncbi:YihY/virulence factor BrkB family protein [Aquibium sp. A9E412]|uniref:YihY/virulence factor BrkB family protein n=1 Tax=Aquibium sp. A9E412 TaxID=2976767 RepID=UPI0025B186BB|nr:YihY/virulence factor BrkB family protein [Aquibium sp. A9E412]MDN2566102.1 YihY/virulence factor BrkB family protein [Aquibium sp. A9E412]